MQKIRRATESETEDSRRWSETDSRGYYWEWEGTIESHEYAEFYNFMVTIIKGDKIRSYVVKEEYEHECEPSLNLAEEIGCMYEAMADAAQDR